MRLVDEAAEVAEGELAGATQEARAAAHLAAAAGAGAALEILGSDAGGQGPPIRADGGRGGALAVGGGGGVGSVGRLGKRDRLRPVLLGGARASDASKEAAHAVRNARGVPSERV